MKNRELVEKLLKLDPELEVGIDDSEWGFDFIAEVVVESQHVLEMDEVSISCNPEVPSYSRSKEPREVVVFRS